MRFWPFSARRQPPLAAAERAALNAFKALPVCDTMHAIDSQRFIVVDVESSGLNLTTDRLIAIGAVTVVGGTIKLNQGVDLVLRQSAPSEVDNILIHGIDGTTQTCGQNPTSALLEFLNFIGDSPLVAYHAPFDRSMIDKATTTYLGMRIGNPWLDLAHLTPALFPEMAKAQRNLDDWVSTFNIVNANRHNAVADALATAQLLLVVLARAQEQKSTRLRDLLRIEKAQQWLSR